MKQHFQKYGNIYQVIFIAICIILSCTFVYLGSKNRKQHHYTEEEITGIMKLKADKLTRIIEIQAIEGACDNSDPTTLTDEQMETYGFEKELYEKVIYTMSCKDNSQIVAISIYGTGDFKGYQITNYISNQKGA